VATKQVNIDIIAKDKTRQAMQSATKGINRVKDSVFNLRNALLGLGAGFVAKGFLDTAREVENLRVRFKFLFADAKEGEKAFKGLIKFASQVPFTLSEIQRGSANLSVVSKDAEELNELLKITGDIASASGLDFQTTAEQIQRTFSSGINSADLFRERGVRALLGFEAGVQMSAEKSKEHIIKAFREGTLSVVGASDEMAKTFDGTISMISDGFTRFQVAVMDSSPFVALKTVAQQTVKSMNDNFGSIEKFAEKVGQTIVSVTAKVLLFGASVIDQFGGVFKFIGLSIANLVNFVRGLPPPMDTLGVIGFMMLGGKGKAGVLLIAGFIDDIRNRLGLFLEDFANFNQSILETRKRLRLVGEEGFAKISEENKNLLESAKELQTPYRELAETIDEAGNSGMIVFKELQLQIEESKAKTGGLTEALLEQFRILEEALAKHREMREKADEDSSIKKEIEEVGMLKKAYDEFTGGFMDSVNAQKTGFQQIRDIGSQTFGKLKSTLADFIMTGKASFGDLARFVVRSFLEMLIGQAVKMAFAKSLAFFKANAIAKATISAIQSVVTTIASYPFPFNVGVGAGALAFAMGFVNKIKAFEKGGRPPVGRPSLVGEKGAELFVPDQAGTIVPNDKLGMMNRQPVTVNFNISTVDARGFNELLVNSRGTIVNLINSAVNEKGKMAII